MNAMGKACLSNKLLNENFFLLLIYWFFKSNEMTKLIIPNKKLI